MSKVPKSRTGVLLHVVTAQLLQRAPLPTFRALLRWILACTTACSWNGMEQGNRRPLDLIVCHWTSLCVVASWLARGKRMEQYSRGMHQWGDVAGSAWSYMEEVRIRMHSTELPPGKAREGGACHPKWCHSLQAKNTPNKVSIYGHSGQQMVQGDTVTTGVRKSTTVECFSL